MPGTDDRRLLRAAVVVETATLAALLANLFTVHRPEISGVLGPLHGTAYLITIGATIAVGAPARARLLAWVPAIGGLLALRATPRTPSTAASAAPREPSV